MSHAWGPEKKLHWFLKQKSHRSYQADVLSRIEKIAQQRPSAIVAEYGRLTISPDRYPLFSVSIGEPGNRKPNILITGGVHGYETSGVKGALQFLEHSAVPYSEYFNFLVAPCISPWSYETINRLNPVMENPNREFKAEGKAEESRLLIEHLQAVGWGFDGHLDLHETTDSDRVFLPEEYAKNGLVLSAEDVGIPDGYYLIGVKGHEKPALEKAIIEKVREVTHIAAPDGNGKILDIPISQEGVIHNSIPGLCGQYTSAVGRLGAFTTEMYPDSPRFKTLSPEAVESICSDSQVASIRGALDFWKK